MSKKSIIYWGTPEFAVPIFNSLAEAGRIAAAVTQPDKPKGKKRSVLHPSPVKVAAEKIGIPILQPEKLSDTSFIDALHQYEDCTFVIVAYGKLIPEKILEISAKPSVNIHPSLLPELRGPSPIQSALLEGRTETGITFMQLDEEMDHGPILAQERFAIADDDTYASLSSRIASTTAQRIVSWVDAYLDGSLQPREQDHEKATYCKKITKEDGVVNFNSETEAEIFNKVRALTPWPGVWVTIHDTRLRINTAKPSTKNVSAGVLEADAGQLFLGCKEGTLEIIELQPDGKKLMSAGEFLNGRPKCVSGI